MLIPKKKKRSGRASGSIESCNARPASNRWKHANIKRKQGSRMNDGSGGVCSRKQKKATSGSWYTQQTANRSQRTSQFIGLMPVSFYGSALGVFLLFSPPETLPHLLSTRSLLPYSKQTGSKIGATGLMKFSRALQCLRSLIYLICLFWLQLIRAASAHQR